MSHLSCFDFAISDRISIATEYRLQISHERSARSLVCAYTKTLIIKKSLATIISEIYAQHTYKCFYYTDAAPLPSFGMLFMCCTILNNHPIGKFHGKSNTTIETLSFSYFSFALLYYLRVRVCMCALLTLIYGHFLWSIVLFG